jgi:hypothetical protein
MIEVEELAQIDLAKSKHQAILDEMLLPPKLYQGEVLRCETAGRPPQRPYVPAKLGRRDRRVAVSCLHTEAEIPELA